VDADGTLYALEMSTGNTAAPPFLVPASGQIVMQTGPDSSQVVAGGLMFPVAMEIGPDGSFYVSTPAIGSNGGDGMIVRLGDASSTPMSTAACAPISETLTAAPASTPGSNPASTPAAAAAVTIANFAFAPPSLQIAAGTTVTFTNNDTTAHTATADDGSFDTGTIDPGTSAEITFNTPGTYTYKCKFHASMTGTIIVN
jgi:plastocyanin